MLYYNKIFIF